GGCIRAFAGRMGCWLGSRAVLKVPFRVKGAGHHHGGYGVLEDQLLLVVVFQDYRVLVEGANPSGQFHAAEQVKRDGNLVLTSSIQKRILNVLSCLEFHGSSAARAQETSQPHISAPDEEGSGDAADRSRLTYAPTPEAEPKC